MKALALFSGGLDSALAIKVIKEQGIEVIALNFVSYFFGGKDERAEKMAEQLGVQLEYVNFKDKHMEIIKNPESGRGKNMNPCIDCHALMFKVAYKLLEKYEASFIISGEVLGQRPMSQNKSALNRVRNLSGCGDLILRPLSGKILDETYPEKMGWIKRENLLDINGRGRKRQMELADFYGIKEYPSPAGGCLLTEPNYSKRLKVLEDDNYLDSKYTHLINLARMGRFFRIDTGKYLFIGRKEEENLKIKEYKENSNIYIQGKDTPGPYIIGFGNFSEEDENFALNLFSRYSKAKGKDKIELYFNDEVKSVDIVDLIKLEEKINKYQIV